MLAVHSDLPHLHPHPIHFVPGFAFGISQPVEGAAVGSVLGDDQDRCTRPADPPKLLTICQHDQIAGGRVLEVCGHRSTVETQGCSTGHMRSGGDYLSGIRRLSCGFPQDTWTGRSTDVLKTSRAEQPCLAWCSASFLRGIRWRQAG